MDVQEFANVFLDKLEQSLKGTPQERLLEDVFGGTVVSQVICKECPHRSERTEPFITISIDVKNNPTIEDGLKVRKLCSLLFTHTAIIVCARSRPVLMLAFNSIMFKPRCSTAITSTIAARATSAWLRFAAFACKSRRPISSFTSNGMTSLFRGTNMDR